MADIDLAEVLAQFTNLIMNERVRSYNEGVDAERERCAKIAEAFVFSMRADGTTPKVVMAEQTIANLIRAGVEGAC